MIWALLALLGIPIWLILGALAAASVSRRNFQTSDGVLPLQILESSDTKFQRKAHGRWVHDVLIINKGLALVRTTPYGVQSLKLHGDSDIRIKGLGDKPVVFNVRTDGGEEALLAVPAEYRDVAAGPFVAS